KLGAVTNATCGNTFTAICTWRATDACGNHSDCSQTVRVVDTTVPTITCVADRIVECGTAWTFDPPTASDLCGPAPQITKLGTVTNATCGNTFAATCTWRATDACGNHSECSQTVRVVDTTAPTITCVADKVVECGTAWAFDPPTASDLCGPAPQITKLGPVTNATCGNTFTATCTWRATDACGNRSECSQTVRVVDTTAPTITCVADKVVECGTAWAFDPPTASDLCGPAPQIA